MDDQMNMNEDCGRTVAIVAEKLRFQTQKPANPFILSAGAIVNVVFGFEIKTGSRKTCSASLLVVAIVCRGSIRLSQP